MSGTGPDPVALPECGPTSSSIATALHMPGVTGTIGETGATGSTLITAWANPPLATAPGFTMCSGTSGGGQGSPTALTALIPNTEIQETRNFLNIFSTAVSAKHTTSSGGTYVTGWGTPLNNACLTVGVPPPAALRPGLSSTALAQLVPWNMAMPYATGVGCCSPASAWTTGAPGQPTALRSNASRATRLYPFTTASKLGARDDAGLVGGVPPDLVGLTKVWGTSSDNWMHGGTHADNVGVWNKDVNGEAFTIKNQGATWKQDRVLWCRMTGDSYNPDKDPYGAVAPAPAGQYKWKPSSGDVKVPDPCKGCAIGGGQIFGAGNGASDYGAASCRSPYTQYCYQKPLTPDMMQGDSPYAATVNRWTGENNGYSDYRGRVGGVFGTRDMYGPGKFTVLLNLPPTAPASPSDAITRPGYPWVNATTGAYGSKAHAEASGRGAVVPGGRGYVFSIWTFSYTEAYTTGKAPTAFNAPQFPANTPGQAGGGYAEGVLGTASSSTGWSSAEVAAAVYGAQDVPRGPSGAVLPGTFTTGTITTGPPLDGFIQGNVNDGWFGVHNHEIDIEIPANTAEWQGPDMMTALDLNTANYNTWLTDQDSYNEGDAVMYQQAQATGDKAMGHWFANVGPSDDESTYTEHSFVWYVDPDEEAGLPPVTSSTASGVVTPTTKSYVAFYRDGVEVFKCHRYVPRRSGRVLIGLWPGWWGSNDYPLTYNHVYARIARMEFVPQCDYSNTRFPNGAVVTNVAQMYDMEFPVPPAFQKALTASGQLTSSSFSTTEPAASIQCGFDVVISQRAPIAAPGTVVITKSWWDSNKTWVFVAAGVVGLIIIIAIIAAVATKNSAKRPGPGRPGAPVMVIGRPPPAAAASLPSTAPALTSTFAPTPTSTPTLGSRSRM